MPAGRRQRCAVAYESPEVTRRRLLAQVPRRRGRGGLRDARHPVKAVHQLFARATPVPEQAVEDRHHDVSLAFTREVDGRPGDRVHPQAVPADNVLRRCRGRLHRSPAALTGSSIPRKHGFTWPLRISPSIAAFDSPSASSSRRDRHIGSGTPNVGSPAGPQFGAGPNCGPKEGVDTNPGGRFAPSLTFTAGIRRCLSVESPATLRRTSWSAQEVGRR